MIWSCNVCNHLSLGTRGPESCPVCGVSRDQFHEWASAEHIAGTETEANLADAFEGKAIMYARLLAWSTIAELQGDREAAALFRQRADEDMAHAISHLIRLGEISDTGVNLQTAQTESGNNHHIVYPGYFSAAEDEGFANAGHYFATVGQRELTHSDTYQELIERAYTSAVIQARP